jgi:hypothetical protein
MIELIAFLVIFAAMLIRTLTGFGSALIAIPLLSVLFGAKYAVPFILLYECLIDLMILSSQGIAKEEFRRLIVIFLTVIDFLTFFYFLWIGLIDADMLLQGLKLLPALALGITLAAGIGLMVVY